MSFRLRRSETPTHEDPVRLDLKLKKGKSHKDWKSPGGGGWAGGKDERRAHALGVQSQARGRSGHGHDGGEQIGRKAELRHGDKILRLDQVLTSALGSLSISEYVVSVRRPIEQQPFQGAQMCRFRNSFAQSVVGMTDLISWPPYARTLSSCQVDMVSRHAPTARK